MTNVMRQQGGRQDHILQLLERAIKANPDEAMLALAFGDQAERRGETDAAVDRLSGCARHVRAAHCPWPQSARQQRQPAYAFARLAGVSEDKGEIEPAMNYYRAAVAAVPDLPWP